MKSLSVLFLLSGLAWGQESDSFEVLKKLVGEWHGVGPNEMQVHVTYELWSGGHSLVEVRRPVGEPDMVTVFHRDGDRVLLTHYCSAGNQPRMVMKPSSSVNQIAFEFLDLTNPDAHAGYMTGLRYAFKDADHVAQTWVWQEAGNDHETAFELTRVK